MRLSNGFVIDKEKTFGELKFTAVRDVFLQNEDGTPSTQLKKRIYDLKCSLHGGIIPVSVGVWKDGLLVRLRLAVSLVRWQVARFQTEKRQGTQPQKAVGAIPLPAWDSVQAQRWVLS